MSVTGQRPLRTDQSSGIGSVPMRALFEDGTLTGLTDGQLLERFTLGERELAEAAFTLWSSGMAPWCCGSVNKCLAIRTRPRMSSRQRFSFWPEKLARFGGRTRWRTGFMAWRGDCRFDPGGWPPAVESSNASGCSGQDGRSRHRHLLRAVAGTVRRARSAAPAVPSGHRALRS